MKDDAAFAAPSGPFATDVIFEDRLKPKLIIVNRADQFFTERVRPAYDGLRALANYRIHMHHVVGGRYRALGTWLALARRKILDVRDEGHEVILVTTCRDSADVASLLAVLPFDEFAVFVFNCATEAARPDRGFARALAIAREVGVNLPPTP